MFWLFLALLLPLKVEAATTELELKILPLDCVFDIVNDGSNQIVYLTPKECGVLTEEPGGAPDLQPATIGDALSVDSLPLVEPADPVIGSATKSTFLADFFGRVDAFNAFLYTLALLSLTYIIDNWLFRAIIRNTVVGFIRILLSKF